jgi:hypothetical protein
MRRHVGVVVVCEASREMANAMHESFIRMTRTPHARIQFGRLKSED